MIVFDSVSKTFPNGFTAVSDLSFQAKEGETLVLLGTSGSGKTTTMKMINRLIDPSAGTILLGGEDVMSKNPVELRRGVGYAIQHIGLFPHMTISENIGVTPRLLGWSPNKIKIRVDELLVMVGLEPNEYVNRYPWQLSGGQRQRVGVARALAADPPVVLMDEPFGALDPITREELQNEFLKLKSDIKKTVIFVTHDVFEAVKMGDRVALLDAGRLRQIASPTELVEKPADEFVERFLGKHRFQLSLLTTKLNSLDLIQPLKSPNPDEERNSLRPTSTLEDALDKLKSGGTGEVTIRDERNQPIGMVGKSDLLRAIGDIMTLEAS